MRKWLNPTEWLLRERTKQDEKLNNDRILGDAVTGEQG